MALLKVICWAIIFIMRLFNYSERISSALTRNPKKIVTMKMTAAVLMMFL